MVQVCSSRVFLIHKCVLISGLQGAFGVVEEKEQE
jgi:hypothetical protein